MTDFNATPGKNMPTEEILRSLVIIIAASTATVFLLQKLKVPSLVGFLIAGALIGPYGLRIASDTAVIETLAEVGVILLLFTIGIEFSLKKLAGMKKAVAVGGGLQVLMTIALAAGISYMFLHNPGKALLIGFLTALSSTAIVLKVTDQAGETDSPHGRLMLGILIFQDLCTVLLILLVPVLAGAGQPGAGQPGIVPALENIGLMVLKASLIIGFVLLSSRWLIPGLLHQVVRTKSRELFIMTIILLSIAIALLTSEFGLSLALGAFLAGLAISESEYAHQATSDILPFKESFMGLFFVSIGMLLDMGFVVHHAIGVIAVVLSILVIKSATGTVSAFLAGAPARTSLQAGLGLAHIGEFSFILAVAGKNNGLLGYGSYQLFLSASVLTMLATPFLLKYGRPFAEMAVASGPFRFLFGKAGWLAPGRPTPGWLAPEGVGPATRLQGHVIIIGFGLNGRNLARVLREADVPYVVLDLNSETVREMGAKKEPIHYGDGTSVEILEKLGIKSARLLVVAISDPASTRRIVAVSKGENRKIYIIVRTRYVSETDDLKALGADEVIPEEFETSIEIFSRVLDRYKFPPHVIAEMAERVRSGSYTALRRVEMPRQCLFPACEWLPEIEMDGIRLPEGSPHAGRTIGEMKVRSRTGATIIAVRRDSGVHTNPRPDFRLKAGDIILFTGDRASMDSAEKFFQGS